MDIQLSKIELVRTILNIENEELIKKLISFIQNEQVDFWSQLDKEQQNEISEGIQQLDSGKRVAYESFLEKFS
jgi:hypothetical protein